ncbi:MAG: putative membrane protein YfhO [Flavobacteriales bacterium]
MLRALVVPPGDHTLEFKFEPQVIKTGSIITVISVIGMLSLLIGGIYYEQKNNWRKKEANSIN